jgi:hypothetical protein
MGVGRKCKTKVNKWVDRLSRGEAYCQSWKPACGREKDLPVNPNERCAAPKPSVRILI